ncbi:putative 37S ribosomal protein rsm25 [Rosellinia necatrix]|uniref:37S ribosomal protein S25, mitochondrial n=1 Tax=Rosellinia necatrix TaxID=77044 RepID=A0A1W2TC70_ROSNE|nr:putative 37S ribosomal protein rsm25 [Rosellinia necatrix]
MGGQRQIRPTRVYQTVTNMLNHRIVESLKVQIPLWYRVVESIPPSETLTRPYPPQHKQHNPKVRKPSRLFQPQQLVYEEDDLRRQFYKEHPWELARPRMIVEMDGRDAERYDWSRGLQQPGMPLCGESVVQRQLWMMHNVEGMTREKAYDIVRREFYALRHAEDVERRIAKEEAMKVGAYFGKSALQVGMGLEDRQYEGWRKWATKQVQGAQAEQDAAYTNFGATEEADAEDIDANEMEESASQGTSGGEAPTGTERR